MNAGRLNQIITVERPTISKDDYGANQTTWNNIITTRADVQFDGGNRITENSEIIHSYTKTFTIRYYHKVDEKDRILWEGKHYRILSIEKDRDKMNLTIRTELINE